MKKAKRVFAVGYVKNGVLVIVKKAPLTPSAKVTP